MQRDNTSVYVTEGHALALHHMDCRLCTVPWTACTPMHNAPPPSRCSKGNRGAASATQTAAANPSQPSGLTRRSCFHIPSSASLHEAGSLPGQLLEHWQQNEPVLQPVTVHWQHSDPALQPVPEPVPELEHQQQQQPGPGRAAAAKHIVSAAPMSFGDFLAANCNNTQHQAGIPTANNIACSTGLTACAKCGKQSECVLSVMVTEDRGGGVGANTAEAPASKLSHTCETASALGWADDGLTVALTGMATASATACAAAD